MTRNAPSLLRVGAIRDVVEVCEPVLDLGRLAVLSRDFDLLDDVGGFVLVAHLGDMRGVERVEREELVLGRNTERSGGKEEFEREEKRPRGG
jgi:hypothetical protein